MRLIRCLAIAVHAALLLLAGYAVPALAAQKELVWGVNGHPLASYPGVSIESQLDYVRELGLTSYRVDIAGPEKLPVMRRLVREAKARGITVLPVVTPAFDFGKETPESLKKQAYDLAFALVSGLKGEIPVWELGNELENYAIIQPCEMQDDGKQYDCSWGPAGGPSPLDYFGPRWAKVSAVLKGLTEGAHAADPSVRRALGTAGWGHIGAFERMKADGIDWDISVWHMYGEDPEWAFKKLVEYKRPIWVTEFNNARGSETSNELQVQGLMRSMSRLTQLQESYGVEAAHIYELIDEPYWGPSFEAYMGLVEMTKNDGGQWMTGERKPAFDAVKKRLAGSVGGVQRSRDIAIGRQCELKPAQDSEASEAQAIVSYSYCLVLGRPPDGAGMSGYASRLLGDLTVGQLLLEIMDSDEFAKRYGVSRFTTSEYVTLLHRLLLGAEPAESALKEMTVSLEGKTSRADLQREVINSEAFRNRHPVLVKKLAPVAVATDVPKTPRPKPEVRRSCDLNVMSWPLEFERGQVIYSFCLVLGRWPDGYGLGSWTTNRRNGVTLEHFLLALLHSEEFARKYQTGILDNAEFVTLLYRLLLNRDPEADALHSYESQLASGPTSRSQVCETIIMSDEFRAKQEVLFKARMPEKARAEMP
jgi:hypothetical protein